MDAAKLRFAAGACAALLSVVGLLAISVAATLALEPTVGLAAGSLITGLTLLALGAVSFFFFARPDTAADEEVAKIESVAAEALADLPFDALKAVVEKRPIASLAIAATTGYTISRDPSSAARHLQRALTGLL